ncbi:MAG: M20 family metallopeptidase [Candidatus Azobacteroides sp.]|nr:M20 family metallopeptidase [Candidatus Azobacteroides sp.]
MFSNLISSRIKNKVEEYYQEIISDYRYLHSHPELSYKEHNTSEFVQSQLKELGIEFQSGIAGTGVLGVIKGKNPDKKIVALRADMDALPIQEINDIPHKSQNENVMHACGHDAHTASLLGVARILNELKHEFEGTVLLVFQPGEEKHPGGARLMLEAGVFNEYKPDLMIAQHVYVDYKVGEVGFEPGIIMAAADEVHIKIRGKGGHGALPHLVNDTVLAASQCIVSLQQIASRRSNPFNPVVLSFGKLLAFGDTNVIPDEVTVAGTLRTMNEKERSRMKELIKEVAIHTVNAYGCRCEIEVYDGYPCVKNDEQITSLAKTYAIEYLGKESVKGLEKRMTAEDFGFFSQLYPTTFYRFGVQGKHPCSGLHTSTFLIDEEALKTSVGVMAFLACRFLSIQGV